MNQLAQLLSPQQRLLMERVRDVLVPPPLEQTSPVVGNALGQPSFSPVDQAAAGGATEV